MRRFIFALVLISACANAQETSTAKDRPLPAALPNDRLSLGDAGKDEAAKRALASGWQQLESGDTAVAITFFNKAAMLNPNDANAYWGMGMALAKQRKFDIAVQVLERAAALEPKNVQLAADTGLAYTRASTDSVSGLAQRAKSLQDALAWFDRAEKIDPSYALVYANRAVALSLLGDFDKAWANVARAEALDKHSVDPKLIEFLSEKQPRPEPEAPAKEAALAKADLPKDSQPAMRENPSTAQPAEMSAGAASAPLPSTSAQAQSAESPVKPSAQKGMQPDAPTVAETKPAPSDDAQPDAESQKTLRVITGKPVGRTDRDVRRCLTLSTNEAIIRCVYPRR